MHSITGICSACFISLYVHDGLLVCNSMKFYSLTHYDFSHRREVIVTSSVLTCEIAKVNHVPFA